MLHIHLCNVFKLYENKEIQAMKGGDGRRKRARKVKEKKLVFPLKEDCSRKALERIDQPKKV